MSLQTISIQNRNLALEAFNLTDLQESLSRIFPRMVDSFKGFLSTFNPKVPGISLTVNKGKLESLLAKNNYMDIEGLFVTIPEGMVVDYATYIKTLAKAAEYSKETYEKTLTKISMYLAMLVTDTNRKFDSQGLVTDLRKRQTEREAIAASMAKESDGNLNDVRAPIGKVVSRNGDWKTIFNDFENVGRVLNSIDRNKLDRKIRESVQYMDTIIAKIKRGELEGVSPETVTSLGEAILQAGHDLEFISVTLFRGVACAQALNQAGNDLIKMLS